MPVAFPIWDFFDFLCVLCVILALFAVMLLGMWSPDLTREIIGAAIRIHRVLGPGLLESAYEACLAHEIQELGLRVERQKPIPLVYKGIKLECGFRADLVIENRVVVETKCKEAIHPVDEAQLLSHLRLLNLHVGLLINFHVMSLRHGIKRIVNDYQEPIGIAS